MSVVSVTYNAVVDLDVLFEVRAGGKGPAAHVTLVWLLTSVDSLVADQV